PANRATTIPMRIGCSILIVLGTLRRPAQPFRSQRRMAQRLAGFAPDTRLRRLRPLEGLRGENGPPYRALWSAAMRRERTSDQGTEETAFESSSRMRR